MVNIGHRPTYDNGALKVEVHILNWEGDLYGSNLRVSFMERYVMSAHLTIPMHLKHNYRLTKSYAVRATLRFLETANK